MGYTTNLAMTTTVENEADKIGPGRVACDTDSLPKRRIGGLGSVVTRKAGLNIPTIYERQ